MMRSSKYTPKGFSRPAKKSAAKQNVPESKESKKKRPDSRRKRKMHEHPEALLKGKSTSHEAFKPQTKPESSFPLPGSSLKKMAPAPPKSAPKLLPSAANMDFRREGAPTQRMLPRPRKEPSASKKKPSGPVPLSLPFSRSLPEDSDSETAYQPSTLPPSFLVAYPSLLADKISEIQASRMQREDRTPRLTQAPRPNLVKVGKLVRRRGCSSWEVWLEGEPGQGMGSDRRPKRRVLEEEGEAESKLLEAEEDTKPAKRTGRGRRGNKGTGRKSASVESMREEEEEDDDEEEEDRREDKGEEDDDEGAFEILRMTQPFSSMAMKSVFTLIRSKKGSRLGEPDMVMDEEEEEEEEEEEPEVRFVSSLNSLFRIHY